MIRLWWPHKKGAPNEEKQKDNHSRRKESEREEKKKKKKPVSSLWLPGDLWAVGMDPVLSLSLSISLYFIFIPFQTRTLELRLLLRPRTRRLCFLNWSSQNFKARDGYILRETVCVCVSLSRRYSSSSLSLSLSRSICRQSQSTRSYLSLSPSFSSDLAGGCRAKSISAGSAQSPWQLNATSFSSPLRHSPPFRLSLFLRHKVSLYLSVEIKGRE